jgi:hypothetical protein
LILIKIVYNVYALVCLKKKVSKRCLAEYLFSVTPQLLFSVTPPTLKMDALIPERYLERQMDFVTLTINLSINDRKELSTSSDEIEGIDEDHYDSMQTIVETTTSPAHRKCNGPLSDTRSNGFDFLFRVSNTSVDFSNSMSKSQSMRRSKSPEACMRLPRCLQKAHGIDSKLPYPLTKQARVLLYCVLITKKKI